MCNITKSTALTTKTIYKVVRKIDDKYIAPFSGMELEIGPVKINWVPNQQYAYYMHHQRMPIQKYLHSIFLHNTLMIGKTSGFASLTAAKQLLTLEKRNHTKKKSIAILSIKLGGEIYEGTSAKIGMRNDNFKTYAGSEILSIKEL